jgi:GTP cyclohydrolase I
MKNNVVQKRIEEAVKVILGVLGIKTNSEIFQNTPERVAKMYLELFSGIDGNNEPKLTLFNNRGYHDILALKRIPFYSLCAHHLLPILGDVSIAYIPGNKIIGLSKIPRIVKYLASKPQIQEDFTKELADFLHGKLEANGVFVMVRARHLCLEMRGIKANNVEAISSAIRGVFETEKSTKEEAMRLLIS